MQAPADNSNDGRSNACGRDRDCKQSTCPKPLCGQAAAAAAERSGALEPPWPPSECFELGGNQFLVMSEEAWHKSSHERQSGDAELRLAGRLQVAGRQHVILVRHTATTDRVAPRGFFSLLTPRELQIASLVAEGCSDKAIARHLGISGNTVREHVRRMFHKANVSKRAALATLLTCNAEKRRGCSSKTNPC